MGTTLCRNTIFLIPMFILSGCMGFVDEDTTKINIELDVDSNYGLIMVSFEDGEETNRINPVIGFSFSKLASYRSFRLLPNKSNIITKYFRPRLPGENSSVEYTLGTY